VGLVVARAYVHDRREVTDFKQANAIKVRDCTRSGKLRDAQEPENIELVHVLDTGGGKGEDSPRQLEKGDVKRGIDLHSCQQIG
jgi:hypothetical protein